MPAFPLFLLPSRPAALFPVQKSQGDEQLRHRNCFLSMTGSPCSVVKIHTDAAANEL